MLHRDRKGRRGGGAAVYVSSWMQADIWSQPGSTSQYEMLWVQVRDTSCDMFIGALYHPPRPSYKSSELLGHLQDCVNTLTESFMEVSVVLVGDFNSLDQDVVSYCTCVWERQYSLHQSPTCLTDQCLQSYEAGKLLLTLRKSSTLQFLLVLWHFLQPLARLSKTLQSSSGNTAAAMAVVKATVAALQDEFNLADIKAQCEDMTKQADVKIEKGSLSVKHRCHLWEISQSGCGQYGCPVFWFCYKFVWGK